MRVQLILYNICQASHALADDPTRMIAGEGQKRVIKIKRGNI